MCVGGVHIHPGCTSACGGQRTLGVGCCSSEATLRQGGFGFGFVVVLDTGAHAYQTELTKLLSEHQGSANLSLTGFFFFFLFLSFFLSSSSSFLNVVSIN